MSKDILIVEGLSSLGTAIRYILRDGVGIPQYQSAVSGEWYESSGGNKHAELLAYAVAGMLAGESIPSIAEPELSEIAQLAKERITSCWRHVSPCETRLYIAGREVGRIDREMTGRTWLGYDALNASIDAVNAFEKGEAMKQLHQWAAK